MYIPSINNINKYVRTAIVLWLDLKTIELIRIPVFTALSNNSLLFNMQLIQQQYANISNVD